MSDYTILQGNTSPSLEVYADIMTDVTGWACSMTLTTPDGTKVIDRAVTDTTQDLTKFVAFLTEAETDALAVETYVWVITLTNPNLNPAFEAVEIHNIMIEPPASSQTRLQLVRGENTFADYETILLQVAQMPELYGINGVSRTRLKSAVVEAWFNIGALAVDFGNDIQTTRYFGASVLDALAASEQSALLRAQLLEADFILTAHPAARDATVRSITAGESKTVYRNNRAVIVSRDAIRILDPYLVKGQAHTAAIHV